MTTQPHVVTDPQIPAGRLILDGIDIKDPLFGVSEAAKTFFGRSSHWVRWLEEQHALVYDGDPNCTHTKTVRKMRPEPVLDEAGKKVKNAEGKVKMVEKVGPVEEPYFDTKGRCKRCRGRRVGERRTPSGARIYSLADIELLAHALAQNGKITGTQLRLALTMVDTAARIWEYI